MLKKIMNNITKKPKQKYVEWNEYKNQIDFLETFNWQQNVRKQSIQNLKFFS